VSSTPETATRSQIPVSGGPKRICEAALRVRALALETWGEDRLVEMIGTSPAIAKLFQSLEKVAPFSEPVLITGESGSGKEGVAQALYLLGPRRGKPLVFVNCPQYMEGNLTVSELFGHRKGGFTGATADRKGCFETADGGVIFLDEIGDLHMSAQVMLLRALANGEFQPLGADFTRRVNVRVVGATNRSLEEMIVGKEFRHDLFFRLRYFLVRVPPLRERGDDWLLLLDYWLDRMQKQYGVEKRFSKESLRLLSGYSWPGNVRELMSLVTSGYAMCDRDVIEPHDFVQQLARGGEESQDLVGKDVYVRVVEGGESFWEVVHKPFLERELNRTQVRLFIQKGLHDCQGSYRALLELLHLPLADYQKLMDFLRHHQLKP
jgi:transcriptional regulator with GAF, ATPase, and Fis domain